MARCVLRFALSRSCYTPPNDVKVPCAPLIATLLAVLTACAASPRPPLRTADSAALTLVNRTSEPVCFLYSSAPNADDWSGDLLGSDTIAPGESHVVYLPRGQFDLRTENCQHETTGTLRSARLTRATELVLQ